MPRAPLYRSLYAQVLAGIALGILLGLVAPETGAAMRPLGDGFIKLIRMLIGPIVFTTIVVGLAQVGEMKEVGRIGLRAAHLFRDHLQRRARHRDGGRQRARSRASASTSRRAPPTCKAAASYGAAASTQDQSTVAFILNLIPTTVVDAFARGDILQVLLVSILTGIALLMLGERARDPGDA